MLNVSRVTRLLRFAVVVAASTAIAGAAAPAVSAGTAQTMQEPPNLGKLKLEVTKYYDGYRDGTGNHHSENSPWAEDTTRQIDKALSYLKRRLLQEDVADLAIVLDIDDTAEITYGFNADNDFGFDPKKQDEAIRKGAFPPIKPTLSLANWAHQHGVEVYFVTGRKDTQKPYSMKNLANAGYPQPADAIFKPTTTAPSWLPCKLKCRTGEFKTHARAYIESRGVTIVLNIGDQDSDLLNGHAEKHVKLPNPMYYVH